VRTLNQRCAYIFGLTPESAEMARVPQNQLEYDEDSGIYLLEGQPFSGVAFKNSPAGWLQSEQAFRQGLPWGDGRSWFGPGRLATESESVGGVWHGSRREWHENGQLALEEECELGITIRRKTWDDSGRPVEDYELKQTDGDYETLVLLRKHASARGWVASES
jgi:antitoxin component YwqK of YwqJK toxin-antitoxin module